MVVTVIGATGDVVWINAKPATLDQATTMDVCAGKKPFPEDQVWTAPGSDGPCGFALETGEPETHGDFDAFRKAVAEKSKLDPTKLKDGEAHLTAADGTRTGLKLTPAGRPIVFRDGKEHDWKSHWPIWSGERSPITLGWKSGELRITAGSQTFTGKLRDGKYVFGNGNAE